MSQDERARLQHILEAISRVREYTAEWQGRITMKAEVFGGQPCIRDTRIPVAVILDGLAEGLSAGDLRSHYPSLAAEDVAAAFAYAAELSRESVWRVAVP